MEIEVYTFEDANGAADSFTTQDLGEAHARARRYRLRLIANTFEWADSEMIEDFTEQGEAD